MGPYRAFAITLIAVVTQYILANPIGNTSASIGISKRAPNTPWVRLCSDFDLQKCTPELSFSGDCSGSNCIERYICMTTITSEALENGGVSSLEVSSRDICKFYHTDNCNKLFDENMDSNFVGLPIGWNSNEQRPDDRGKFLEHDTSICSLWDYTKSAHGGTEHWDNKIRSFFCGGETNVEGQKSSICGNWTLPHLWDEKRSDCCFFALLVSIATKGLLIGNCQKWFFGK